MKKQFILDYVIAKVSQRTSLHHHFSASGAHKPLSIEEITKVAVQEANDIWDTLPEEYTGLTKSIDVVG